jgi:protein-tyrosine phosphatase
MISILSIIRVIYIKLIQYIKDSQSNNLRRQFKIEPIIKQIKLITQEPTCIINNIYIGNAYNAANYNTLKKYKFNIIINATDIIQNYYENYFNYIKYEITDNEFTSIQNILIHSYNYLKDQEYNTILIHCLTGNSQSAAIALFYLTQKYNMTLDDAIKYIKLQRKSININLNYIDDIKNII